MNIIELVGFILLTLLVETAILLWVFDRVFRKSRENSFRRGLQARGYPEQEIDDAVANLNRRKWR